MKISLGAGPGGHDRSEHRSTRRHNGGGGAVTVRAPLVSIQGWIRATIFGAQPNQRLGVGPPRVGEIPFWKTPPRGAAQPPPRLVGLQTKIPGGFFGGPTCS